MGEMERELFVNNVLYYIWKLMQYGSVFAICYIMSIPLKEALIQGEKRGGEKEIK